MTKSANRSDVWLIVALTLLVAVPATALSASPQELFERAETMYRQLEVVDPSGQAPTWTRVAAAFSDVAVRYPESPLASEALWRVSWIYGRRARAGDADAAVRQLDVYRDLVRQYPDSPHAPEALLFMAVEAEDEGGARAASLYQRLLQTYPTTPQASLARNRMAEVLRANPDMSLETEDDPLTPAPPASSTLDTAPRTLDGAPPVAASTDRRASEDTETNVEIEPLADNIETDVANLARLTGVRHYSDRTHTRIVLDLDRPVRFETGEAQAPERLFLDLQGVGQPGQLTGATERGLEQVVAVESDAVSRVRVGLNRPGIVRVVLDLDAGSQHTLFTLDKENEPFRIVIDVPTATVASKVNPSRRPPASTRESISEQLGLAVRRIVIDPGHGGNDPGAIGRTGVTEKSLTLQLSHAVAARLRSSGYEVLMTREDDRTVSLEERTEFANRMDADLFISIHINSARNRNLRGFETYYLNLANDPTAAETAARENAPGGAGSMGDLDETLEKIVQNEFRGASSELAASIQDSLVMHVAKHYDNVHDLGVKTAPFFVLVGAKMPAVLVETSFVSNEQEEAWLKSGEYRAELAEALEIGLQSYVDQRKVTVTSGR